MSAPDVTVPTFGLCHDFRQPLPFDMHYASFYAECLAEIEEGDRLGYDTVWLSEHHFVHDGMLSAVFPVAAAIAARTRRIRIGTNIVTLPLHHPLRVAEDATAVDLLSGGRLILGVGQGYAPAEFETLGVDPRSRPSRLEEGVTVIRQAWEQGRTGFTGRRWTFPDLPFEPRPGRRVPIYFGATTETAVDRAVRMADGLLVYCANPADFAERYDMLCRVLAGHPRRTTPFRLVLTGMLLVHDDADQAWAEAASAIAYQERQLGSLRSMPADPPDNDSSGLNRDDYLVGDPATVTDALVELHQRVPFDQFAFWARLPGLSHAQALRSLRLFATQVAPAVKERVAASGPSG